MPKKRTHEQVQCSYFKWIIRERQGVWFADGRANLPSQGRHSLGTRDRKEALEHLRDLDLTKAVEHGLVDRSVLAPPGGDLLDLQAGRELYEEHVRRPDITGGGRPKTAQRYKAVFDKFLPFARKRGVTAWNQLNRRLLEAYVAHLENQEYAPRSRYLEVVTIRQAMKWLADEDHIPATCLFSMKLRKPQGTDTYCWNPGEVAAIVQHCQKDKNLNWLGGVFTALVATGLRISELASLRWSDLVDGHIHLKDESGLAPVRGRTLRQTKSGRGRVLPVHEALKPVLDRLPRSKDGIIFHGPRGGALKPDTLRQILIRDVLKPLSRRFPTPEGEIGFINGRLHSCRHYFCSRAAADGLSEQYIMTWLGHADSDMVRHYFHANDETGRRQMKRLRLFGDVGGAETADEVSDVVPEQPEGKAKRKKK